MVVAGVDTVAGRLAAAVVVAAAAAADLEVAETAEASGPNFLGCHEPWK